MPNESILQRTAFSSSDWADRAASATAEVEEITEAGFEPYEGDTGMAPAMGLQPRDDLGIPDDLPSAFEASFGSEAEIEMGQDEANVAAARAALADIVEETTAFPFRAIAYLLITSPSGNSYRGTGFFISPRTVLTAAHNVTFGTAWAQSITVIPGKNGQTAPFGTIASNSFAAFDGWRLARDSNYDVGAILLPQPVGDVVGWFGIREPQDTEFSAGNVFDLTGYPNDEDTQVTGQGTIRDANPFQLFYDIPGEEGDSGGPIYQNSDVRAIAVHTSQRGSLRAGVRVSPEVHAAIQSWRS